MRWGCIDKSAARITSPIRRGCICHRATRLLSPYDGGVSFIRLLNDFTWKIPTLVGLYRSTHNHVDFPTLLEYMELCKFTEC